MFKFLAILLLIYLAYKLIRIFFYAVFTRRQPRKGPVSGPSEPPKKRKIITKDEGEYVDFEEVKDK